MEKPAALAHEAIHETVEDIFREAEPGVLLDVPAGHGALAYRLKGLGFDVYCCDLYPEIFQLADVEIKAGNLDGSLPYDDGSFDHIVCIEGLEHVENPANAIREFSRLLRTGGMLVVSVPNIMNIEERMRWLFSGYTSHFKPLSAEKLAATRENYPGMEEIGLHVNPIGYSEVRFLLEKSGFTLEQTYVDKPKRNTWPFLPIVVLIKLFSSFTPARKRRERWTDELQSRAVLTGGNTLIFRAKKV